MNLIWIDRFVPWLKPILFRDYVEQTPGRSFYVDLS